MATAHSIVVTHKSTVSWNCHTAVSVLPLFLQWNVSKSLKKNKFLNIGIAQSHLKDNNAQNRV
jgi:hypothetical protein